MKKLVSELYPEIKDCYTINELGEIKNQNTKNIIKHKIEKNGYVRVSLMKKGGGTTYVSLHRILMMAFKPVQNMKDLQVNHKNGNKQDNRLENLEWVTCKENIHHAWKNGLSSAKDIEGEKTNFANYTEKDALKVIELLKTNKYTDKQISEITGLPVRSFIARIRRKETWRYLTKNINQPLGKAERKTFTY